jgi:hypothetical protein
MLNLSRMMLVTLFPYDVKGRQQPIESSEWGREHFWVDLTVSLSIVGVSESSGEKPITHVVHTHETHTVVLIDTRYVRNGDDQSPTSSSPVLTARCAY